MADELATAYTDLVPVLSDAATMVEGLSKKLKSTADSFSTVASQCNATKNAVMKLMSISSATDAISALGLSFQAMAGNLQVASNTLKFFSNAGTSAIHAATAIGSFIKSLGGSSLGAIQAFGKTLAHALLPSSFFKTVQELSGDLSRGLRDCKNDLSKSFSDAGDVIASKFNGLGEKINAKLKGVPGIVGSKLSHIKSVMGESAHKAMDAFCSRFNVSRSIDQEGTKMSNALRGISTVAKKTGSALAVASVGLTSIVGGLFMAGAAALTSGINVEASMNSMVKTINDLIVNMPLVAQEIASQLPMIASFFISAIPALVQSFSQAMMTLGPALIQALTLLMQILPTMLPVLIESITMMIAQLVPVFIELIPLLLEAGLLLFTALLDALSQILPLLIEALPQFIMMVSEALIANLPLLMEGAFTLFMALVQAFIAMLPILISSLPSLINSVISTLISYLPQMGTAAGQLFMSIVEAIPGILGSLVGAVMDLLSRIPSYISGFASSIADAGWNMMMGLIDGIKNAVGNIIGMIGEVCGGIVDSVKSFFGINSPSKLMAQLFGYVGAGAALGIAHQIPRVAGAMHQMVEGVASEAEGLKPELPIAFIWDDEPAGGFAAKKLSEELAVSDIHSVDALAISELESALVASSDKSNEVLMEVANRLTYLLTAIYHVIPSGMDDFDFDRRVRKAVAHG